MIHWHGISTLVADSLYVVARSSEKKDAIMDELGDVKTVVDGRFIIVTLPATLFRATYFKSLDSPGIMQSDHMTTDHKAATSHNEFLALAWRAANNKALEMGWLT